MKIHLPVDFVCGDKFDANCNVKEFNLNTGIEDGWAGYDMGKESRKNISEVVKRAKTIVWNGPQGVFEFEKFKAGSISLLNDIMEATKNGATSIVGGGDSVALVQSVKGAEQKLSHVSTGGGASLELLEGKILPGIDYLTNKEDLDKLLRTA